jgi:hypothetical protein
MVSVSCKSNGNDKELEYNFIAICRNLNLVKYNNRVCALVYCMINPACHPPNKYKACFTQYYDTLKQLLFCSYA